MDSNLNALHEAGQSIWLDNIRRSMFASGELHRLIEVGVRGMTSNPTIFEKAIGSGNDYDAQLKSLIGKEDDANLLFEAIASDDIQHACDEFRALYDSTGGGDGYVSLEVSPGVSHDTAKTIESAKRLWALVDRPNVMIKIPATPEGLLAVTDVIAAGINVNITLIFSVDTYAATADAYVKGIEKRVAAGEPVDRVASVASVFISRIDSAIDAQLETRIKNGERALEPLLGKTGIANVKLIYKRYKEIFEGERFEKLEAKGARVQRPLWASTGTKNPAYRDVMYVENLIGKNTVDTVPPATLDDFLDHGRVVPDTVERNFESAQTTLDGLTAANISLFDVTQKLQVDGLQSFSDSYDKMLDAIREKQSKLRGDGGPNGNGSGGGGAAAPVELSLGDGTAAARSALDELSRNDFLAKLWAHDASPWSSDPAHVKIISNALGWLDFPRTVHERALELVTFASDVAKTFAHVVVLGMGGSSLAPDTLRVTFGKLENRPELHVLDSSDPLQVKTLEAALDLERTLFIVASKSGSTTEPEAFFRYFFERVQKTVGVDRAGDHFIAITDPGTKLESEAKDAKFLRIFENDPNIGGRYSALSFFGMVPAALAGYDAAAIVDRGLGVLDANARTTKVDDAYAVVFGAALGSLAKAGRDKLTIVTHPAIAAFGAWAEQLVAESTGKSGTGIVPIEGEPLGMPHDYGNDRVFVYVGAGLPAGGHVHAEMDASTIETRLAALQEAGHPVIRLAMADTLDIGAQFALWEVATAAAGSVLGIDAFDQPNVQESKDNTKRLLAEYVKQGTFGEPEPKQSSKLAEIFPISGSKKIDLGSDLRSAVRAIVAQIEPGDYVAFNAYVERNEAHEQQLREIRLAVRNALKVATTVGFGPRFLHSTGQLHKGGPNTGVFFQLTTDTPKSDDLDIPGMVSFGTLLRSQALGDFESLDSRDRRGARIHLALPLDTGLEALADAIDDAIVAHA